jgi:uncharacterized NAD(P)/FAD-binding protein YdhS
MDGLRPHTEALWSRLSWAERQSFIRRLRPYWDAHRHRVPEQIAALLISLQEEGRLDVGRGRLVGACEHEEGFRLELADPDDTVDAAWLVNCTGPELDVRSAKIALLESAVSAGLAQYDPLGLGLDVDPEGRTASGANVWALGPLCRGARWETTAIPEIRVQAARIAEGILET